MNEDDDTITITAQHAMTITTAFIVMPDNMTLEDLQGLLNGFAAARGLSMQPIAKAVTPRQMAGGDTYSINLNFNSN